MTERSYWRLKELIFASPEGGYLGSESSLLAQLGASRTAFRQAATLLEGEHLLRIQRGKGGGYFAGRPSRESATTAMAHFCRHIGVSITEMLSVWTMLRSECVRLATRNRGGIAPEELADFIEELRRGDNRRFARNVRRFNGLLARLTGNRLLPLLYEVLHETSGGIYQHDFYRRHPERVVRYRREMLRLAEAIQAGDLRAAEAASRACVELNIDWTNEDHRVAARAPLPTGA